MKPVESYEKLKETVKNLPLYVRMDLFGYCVTQEMFAQVKQYPSLEKYYEVSQSNLEKEGADRYPGFKEFWAEYKEQHPFKNWWDAKSKSDSQSLLLQDVKVLMFFFNEGLMDKLEELCVEMAHKKTMVKSLFV